MIEEVLEGNAALRQRLTDGNATYQEITEAMNYPGVPERIKEAKEIL